MQKLLESFRYLVSKSLYTWRSKLINILFQNYGTVPSFVITQLSCGFVHKVEELSEVHFVSLDASPLYRQLLNVGQWHCDGDGNVLELSLAVVRNDFSLVTM